MACLSRAPKIPGPLIVIGLGIGAMHGFDLQRFGVETVGPIALAPSLPSVPSLEWKHWLRLGELGAAMVLILYAESFGAIRTLALKHGDPVRADRDLFALGLANLLSGLFRGMPVGAGYSASAANEAAGAQSKSAAWVALMVVSLIAWLGLPYLAATPEPVLGAIVIHALWHVLNFKSLAPYFHWRRDRAVVIAALTAVFILGVLDGLLAGIAVSLIMALRGQARSTVTVLGRLGEGHDFVSLAGHASATRVPGVIIVRPEAPLFFANVERMLGEVDKLMHPAVATPDETPIRTIILSLEESPDLDGTTLESLRDFAGNLRARGQALRLARVKDPVFALLERLALPDLPCDETAQ